MLMLAHSALKGARLEPQQAHLAKDNGVQHRTFHGRTTSPYEKDKSTGPRLFSIGQLLLSKRKFGMTSKTAMHSDIVGAN
ncbi:hypothetical protein FRB95_000356 [Tulasnella sp. JGI-2019a]|nr:hypothetical protein FRB95_000356 [Tulasnella sp. JGI-2019a]